MRRYRIRVVRQWRALDVQVPRVAGRGQLRPVTVSASLSCSTAAADRISAAVSESIAGARSALDECRNAAVSFRDETARGFEQADRNTEALVCGVKWASKTLH